MPKITVEFIPAVDVDKITVDIDTVQPANIYLGGITLLKIASEDLTNNRKDEVMALIDELMELGGFRGAGLTTIRCD